jgi:ubiquinone/menaquinone biosynthesis C-methylase UbiE
MTTKPKKAYKGLPLEGFLAHWYARNTGKDIGEYREHARRIAGLLAEDASVLEVAPGPGYLAIELAKLGRYRVVGLDISETFVRMASENAAKAGVAVAFHHGDSAHMPFDSDSFDLIVCRAAFKNFTDPVGALNEMYRVLKAGRQALILDLRPDASTSAIDVHVKNMKLGWGGSLMTKWILNMLRKRAHSREQLHHMAAQTPFKTCEIREESLGFEVVLKKEPHGEKVC